MDEVAEQQEFSQEINTAISQPVGFDGEVDQVIHSENYRQLIF